MAAPHEMPMLHMLKQAGWMLVRRFHLWAALIGLFIATARVFGVFYGFFGPPWEMLFELAIWVLITPMFASLATLIAYVADPEGASPATPLPRRLRWVYADLVRALAKITTVILLISFVLYAVGIIDNPPDIDGYSFKTAFDSLAVGFLLATIALNKNGRYLVTSLIMVHGLSPDQAHAINREASRRQRDNPLFLTIVQSASWFVALFLINPALLPDDLILIFFILPMMTATCSLQIIARTRLAHFAPSMVRSGKIS